MKYDITEFSKDGKVLRFAPSSPCFLTIVQDMMGDKGADRIVAEEHDHPDQAVTHIWVKLEKGWSHAEMKNGEEVWTDRK